MTEIPKFKLYDEDNPEVRQRIQPLLPFRHWDDVEADDKRIMLQRLIKGDWCGASSGPVLQSVHYLNHKYMRLLPGKRLFGYIPAYKYDRLDEDHYELSAAWEDFQDIFVNGHPGEMVLTMLSVFTSYFIEKAALDKAESEEDPEFQDQLINSAYEMFDRLSNVLNYIFEQFCINMEVTRDGFIPRQDEKIVTEIYHPTLMVLSNPKWKPVSEILQSMFDDYRAKRFPEVIAKSSNAIHKFLQILVGDEGNSGKGQFGKLFDVAKHKGLVSDHPFTTRIISALEGFIAEERSRKSPAKPADEEPTAADALIAMNTVMVFLQHCLQDTE